MTVTWGTPYSVLTSTRTYSVRTMVIYSSEYEYEVRSTSTTLTVTEVETTLNKWVRDSQLTVYFSTRTSYSERKTGFFYRYVTFCFVLEISYKSVPYRPPYRPNRNLNHRSQYSVLSTYCTQYSNCIQYPVLVTE